MKFRNRRTGRTAPRQTPIGGHGPERVARFDAATDFDWDFGKKEKGGGGRRALIGWGLIVLGMLGIGVGPVVASFRGIPDSDICLARRVVLARGALLRQPPPELERADVEAVLAYQDRISPASAEGSGRIDETEVKAYLRSRAGAEEGLSYRDLSPELSALTREDETLSVGPESLRCPSGGSYQIFLYSEREQDDEGLVAQFPGVVCTAHEEIAFGGAEDSRHLRRVHNDRMHRLTDPEDPVTTVLQWAWYGGLGLALAGLYLVIRGILKT